MMPGIREDFEKAYLEIDSNPEVFDPKNDFTIALWAAKWMADYIVLNAQKNGPIGADDIRQLAKELQ